MLIRLLLTDIVLIPTESGLDNQSIVKIETELHVSSVFLHLSILGVIRQYFMIVSPKTKYFSNLETI